MSDSIELSLSVDQAMVLSDWLNRKMHTAEMASLVDDRAVWSPLLKISGSLETILALVFDPEYGAALSAARARLVGELGEFGATSDSAE